MEPVYEHFSRHYGSSRRIYVLTLVAITGAFIALFFIRVPVSVQAMGMLTASGERIVLRAPVSGIVEKVGMSENAQVRRGDVLLMLNTGVIEKRDDYVAFKRVELSNEITDLKALIGWCDAREAAAPPFTLRSDKYGGQLNYLLQQLKEATLHAENAELEHARYEQLYQKRMVSDAEFERYRHQLALAHERKTALFEQQRSQWQGELQRATAEWREFEARSQEYAEERKQYTLYAPNHGTIQQFKGIQPLSSLNAGDILAELSPDSGLVVRVQVPPSDIGFIRKDMDVLFRIDAFDYTQWGFAHGKVTDIAADVIVVNGLPLFEVRCSLTEDALTLSNGYRGELKRGMTAQATFVITERTLFQLLYDKADDWLNPQRL